jgi:hypothetical protein
MTDPIEATPKPADTSVIPITVGELQTLDDPRVREIIESNKGKMELFNLTDEQNADESLQLQAAYLLATTIDGKSDVLRAIMYCGDAGQIPYLVALLKAEPPELHADIIEAIRVLASRYTTDSWGVAIGLRDYKGVPAAVKPLLDYAANKRNTPSDRAKAILALVHIPSPPDQMPRARALVKLWEQEDHIEIQAAIDKVKNPGSTP